MENEEKVELVETPVETLVETPETPEVSAQ